MNKKNIVKLSLFTLILAFIAIGTIAVAKVINKEKPVGVTDKAVVMAPIWFEYTGPGASDPGYDPHNPENYTATELSEEPNCEGSDQVCGLKANPVASSGPNPNKLVPNKSNLEDLKEQINDMTPISGQLSFRDE